MGGNCWSRDLKVKRLLKTAALDRRLSLTPPISLDSISSADTHQAISLNAHCFREASSTIVGTACLTVLKLLAPFEVTVSLVGCCSADRQGIAFLFDRVGHVSFVLDAVWQAG